MSRFQSSKVQRSPQSARVNLVILFLLSLLLLSSLPVTPAQTVHVDDDASAGGNGNQNFPYQTIQEGVDGAENGDTVLIHEGQYEEGVLVDKAVELQGENQTNTVLSNDDGTALTVEAAGVALTTFTIQKSETGIHFRSGELDARVENVNVSGNTVGILLEGSSGVSVSESLIQFNQQGVVARDGAADVVVQRSIITDNSLAGVNASDNQNVELVFSYCFWGDITGPGEPESNRDTAGDNVSGPVVFRPWYETGEMSSFRVVNPGEEDEDVSPILYLVLLLVFVLLLLGFAVWLDDSYYEKAFRWFVSTFELEDMTDDQRFWVSMGLYAILLIFLVLLADLAAISIYENSHSLESLQELETTLVARFQRDVLGIELSYNGTSIYYNVDQEWQGHTLEPYEKVGGVAFEVSATCSGFHETIFLSVLILGFKGVSWRVKIKWTGIMAVVIFVENLIRITILFPYYLIYGKAEGEQLHYDWWHTYQYIFIMILFMAWFMLVGLKDMDRQADAKEAAKKAEKKEKEASEKKLEEEQKNKEGDVVAVEESEKELQLVAKDAEKGPASQSNADRESERSAQD